VVVEDTLPVFLPVQAGKVKLNLNGSNFRMILGSPPPGAPSAFGPLYVDSSSVNQIKGGLQPKGFPLGWGYN
jgi:hypothetical protein